MIWFILVFVFLIIESLTVNLVTVWFAIGSLCSFICSYFTDNYVIQIMVFVITSTISLIVSRPILKKHINGKVEKTNFDMIIGKTGIVIKDILKNEYGRVKVLGKNWMATSDEEIKEGTEVEVLKIEGAKIIVRKKEN